MKSNFFKFLFKGFWISFVVFLVYMIIDFLAYGLADPNAWMSTVVSKAIWTLVLAIAYVVIHHTSQNWRPEYPQGSGLTSVSLGHKLINSMVFSLIVSIMLIAAIALCQFLVTTVYVYLLDGIRGIPGSGEDTAVLIGKVIAGGVTVELCGQNQTDTPR